MNRETFPSALFPLRGDLNAEAGATTVEVIGLQNIPIKANPLTDGTVPTYVAANGDIEWEVPTFNSDNVQFISLVAGDVIVWNGSYWVNAPLPEGGTVISFAAGNLSPLFTTSVATDTTTPSLSFILSNAAQNSVFAGPASVGAGAPSFRALVALDIPALPYDASGAAALAQSNAESYANSVNTSGTAAGLSGTPSISITNLTVSGTTSFAAGSIAAAAIGTGYPYSDLTGAPLGVNTWAALSGDLTETQVIPFDGGTVGTPDTGISRISPGEVAIGDGTTGDYSGSLTLGYLDVESPVGSVLPGTTVLATFNCTNTVVATRSTRIRISADYNTNVGFELWDTGVNRWVISSYDNGHTHRDFSFWNSESNVQGFGINGDTNAVLFNAGIIQLGASADTGITRLSGGALAIGNGAQYDYSGSLTLTGLTVTGATSFAAGSIAPASVANIDNLEYPIHDVGGAPAWVKLGTWVGYAGSSITLTLHNGTGYDTGTNEEAVTYITARTASGVSAPNLSGVSYWQFLGGANPLYTQPGILFAATGNSTSATNQSWDVWVNLNVYSPGHYSVSIDTLGGDTWTNIDTTGAEPVGAYVVAAVLASISIANLTVSGTTSFAAGSIALAALGSGTLSQDTSGSSASCTGNAASATVASGLTSTPSISITNLTVSGTTSFAAGSIALAALGSGTLSQNTSGTSAGLSGTPAITVGAVTAGVVTAKRYNAHAGTALVASDYTASSGWGTSPIKTAVRGTDQGATFTIAAAAAVGASPTITLTFHDGTWTQIPVIVVSRQDVVAAAAAPGATVTNQWVVTSVSATAVVFTFNGTPVAGNTYGLSFIAMGT